jgi:hypothetical protein
MSEEQFANGRDRIERAISAAIHPRGQTSISSKLLGLAQAPDAIFEVKIGELEVRVTFTYEEIVESHESLTPEVRAKVRNLAAEVARLPITSSALGG